MRPRMKVRTYLKCLQSALEQDCLAEMMLTVVMSEGDRAARLKSLIMIEEGSDARSKIVVW
jgi:hypothetical protein